MGNTCINPLEELYPLPRKYKTLKVLGEGGFGVVLKCLDQDTKEIVAIKYAKGSDQQPEDEASILTVLMKNNLDQQNIVKFHTGFWMNRCLVFENLDISLYDYLCKKRGPMFLQDIRSVIQQLATALDGLKTVGVIHTDLKTDNIMLVDHVRQPFKLKLIDFGLAIFTSEAKTTRIRQTPCFRAPEIILGHPFSEAVDIWSLGCVMGKMVLGHLIFPGTTNHHLLQYMMEILGPAPHRVINAGSQSKRYFTKYKTPGKCWDKISDKRRYPYRSLDEMKKVRLEKKKNATEADERRECIELLKAMLEWDERERITPKGILNHPFITKSFLNCSYLMRTNVEDKTRETHSPNSTVLPSGIIMVQPAPPERRSSLEETSDKKSVSLSLSSASMAEDTNPNKQPDDTHDGESEKTNVDKTHETHSPTSTVLPSGIIMVQPAPPEHSSPLEETPDKKSINLRLSAAPMAEDTNANKQPDDTDDRESKKKKKKKKNCFDRFLSWIRRRSCKVGHLDM